MTAISPIKLPSEARTLSLPTLAFVVNPEGHAGIVYDSPTGKRTVLARSTDGTLGFGHYGMDPVWRVCRYWMHSRADQIRLVDDAFRELAKVEGWTVLVDGKGLAKVLEQGELAAPKRSERGEV